MYVAVLIAYLLLIAELETVGDKELLNLMVNTNICTVAKLISSPDYQQSVRFAMRRGVTKNKC